MARKYHAIKQAIACAHKIQILAVAALGQKKQQECVLRREKKVFVVNTAGIHKPISKHHEPLQGANMSRNVFRSPRYKEIEVQMGSSLIS